jgi:hypothetical protein
VDNHIYLANTARCCHWARPVKTGWMKSLPQSASTKKLFSKKNLDDLRDANKTGEFVVGMKLAVFKNRHDEFYDIRRYNFIHDDLGVYETTHENDRCIITWTRARAERDRKAREEGPMSGS